MSQLCNAEFDLPHDLESDPDTLSVRDNAVRQTFARVTAGHQRVPPSIAYQAYERSVARENSYASLVGIEKIKLASRNDFILSAREERAELRALRLPHFYRASSHLSQVRTSSPKGF